MGAALLHDLRDPEGAADLHQLASGCDDFLSKGHGGKAQHGGCRIVVDYHGSLCSRDLCNDLLHMVVAQASGSLFQVVFQIGIRISHSRNAFHCSPAQIGAAQVGVEHNAGGVDQRP